MLHRIYRWTIVVLMACLPLGGFAADSGLTTLLSKHSAEETIHQFEAAIRAGSQSAARNAGIAESSNRGH